MVAGLPAPVIQVNVSDKHLELQYHNTNEEEVVNGKEYVDLLTHGHLRLVMPEESGTTEDSTNGTKEVCWLRHRQCQL